jgi:NAD(P)-dependent dehydrogenase (short-subunit alcohol dehydrogenase family)
MQLMQDKVVIITGAARPRGMGRAAAIRFAEHGAKVVVTDLVRPQQEAEDRAAIDLVVEEIRSLGGEALGMGVDVTDRKQVDECVERTVSTFGRVDVVVNNAGITDCVGPFTEQTDAQWDMAFAVHVKGAVYFAQAALPIMQANGGGVIVNNSSMLGLAAEPFAAAYVASKFALVGVTKAIAAEYGKYNIRCNAVCPGAIDTQGQDDGLEKVARWYGTTAEVMKASVETQCALGRQAQPEEVADVMVYLASPMSSYISGAAIPVTGAANPGV